MKHPCIQDIPMSPPASSHLRDALCVFYDARTGDQQDRSQHRLRYRDAKRTSQPHMRCKSLAAPVGSGRPRLVGRQQPEGHEGAGAGTGLAIVVTANAAAMARVMVEKFIYYGKASQGGPDVKKMSRKCRQGKALRRTFERSLE